MRVVRSSNSNSSNASHTQCSPVTFVQRRVFGFSQFLKPPAANTSLCECTTTSHSTTFMNYDSLIVQPAPIELHYVTELSRVLFAMFQQDLESIKKKLRSTGNTKRKNLPNALEVLEL
ncbi:hypothetical protein CBL_04220 [Carabus blaptoides fortunei]